MHQLYVLCSASIEILNITLDPNIYVRVLMLLFHKYPVINQFCWFFSFWWGKRALQVYLLVLMSSLIGLINLDNSFVERFVPINVCSQKLCFLLKSSFLATLKKIHCIFNFLLLSSIYLPLRSWETMDFVIQGRNYPPKNYYCGF